MKPTDLFDKPNTNTPVHLCFQLLVETTKQTFFRKNLTNDTAYSSIIGEVHGGHAMKAYRMTITQTFEIRQTYEDGLFHLWENGARDKNYSAPTPEGVVENYRRDHPDATVSGPNERSI